MVQLTSPNTISAISLCKQQSTLIQHSDEKIIQFELHLLKRYIIFLTDNGKLFTKYLNCNCKPKLMIQYKWFKVSQMAIDWIHDLLYMVADKSDIIVTSISAHHPFSFTNTSLLMPFGSITIKKLLVCPGLSLLVWQEIDWFKENSNRIQVAQQDGTDMSTIYSSKTFIYDLQLDQINLAIYFITNEHLIIISLYSPAHYQHLKSIVKNVSSLKLENAINSVHYFALVCKCQFIYSAKAFSH